MTDTRDSLPTDSDQLEITGEAAAETTLIEEAIHETPESAARSPRTMRILLAALVLATAGFVWFNFLALPTDEQTLVEPVPLPGSRVASGDAAPAVAATVAAGTEAAATEAAAAAAPAADEAAADASAATLPLVAAQDAVLAETAPGVARQLVISELPFLVTVPPLAVQPEEADATAATTRPALQRVSVNPFTPVVLNEVLASAPELPDFPAAGPDTLAEAVEPEVIDVPIPAAPPQATVPRTGAVAAAVQEPTASAAIPTIPAPVQAVAVPPPAAAAPVQPPVQAPVQASAVQTSAASAPLAAVRNLPRALPGGSLSPAPRLLQERRAIEDIPTPNLARLATVQEPEAVQADTVAGTMPRRDLDSTAEVPEPRPLGSASTALAATSSPLAAGVTPLSRYLRDNNVEFTGSVLGPVSVGVFHTSLTNAAIVISLGQSLPDTSIVLTDLRGQQAELTLGEASQILSMELRR